MQKVRHSKSLITLITCQRPDLRMISTEGESVGGWSLLLSLFSKRMAALLKGTLPEEGTYCLCLPVAYQRLKELQLAFLQMDLQFFRVNSDLESIFGVLDQCNDSTNEFPTPLGLNISAYDKIIKTDSEIMEEIKQEPIEMTCEPDTNLLEPRNEDGKFSCDLCDYQSEHISNLSRHKQSIHEVQCTLDLSEFNFDSVTGLTKYEIQMEEKKLPKEEFMCDQCEFRTVYPRNLLRHKQNKHDELSNNKIHCDQCDFSSDRPERVRAHIAAVHDGVKFSCDSCEFETSYKYKLNKHKKTAHPELMQEKIIQGELTCDQCDFRTVYPKNLARHKQNKHGDIFTSRIICDQCDFSSDRPERVRAHIAAVHEGVKYHCDECDFQSSYKYKVTKHHKTEHQGLKLHCDECSFKTGDKYVLTRHKESKHDGIKFDCDQCDYKATQKGTLAVHKSAIHDRTLHKCSLCEFESRYKAEINSHFRKDHNQENMILRVNNDLESIFGVLDQCNESTNEFPTQLGLNISGYDKKIKTDSEMMEEIKQEPIEMTCEPDTNVLLTGTLSLPRNEEHTKHHNMTA